MTEQPEQEQAEEGQEPAAKRKLEIDVQIQDVGPCKKHLKVTVPRAEIEQQFKESLGTIPARRPGSGFPARARTRQLVVKRFRKEVADQVKSALLMASLEQIDADYKLNPITQPKLDSRRSACPTTGPMIFEMEVEVRPEFPVAEYQRPEGQAARARRSASRTWKHSCRGSWNAMPRSSPSWKGQPRSVIILTADLTFFKPDGSRAQARSRKSQFRLQPELRFQDGHVPGIGSALEGVKPARRVRSRPSSVPPWPIRPRAARRSRVKVQVHDLKQMRLPEVNPEFLASIGFDSLEELRDAVRESLKRRHESQQKQAIRRQILDTLIAATPFDLPADLVSRQEKSTVNRLVMELRQEGFSDNDIRAREAEIRANAHEMTRRSLKEFFILAQIAEAEGIKVEDEDLEMEIEAMAARSDESVRRIRARVEKEGLGDALATQILERKALDHILKTVEIEDVLLDEPETAVETVDQTATPAVEPRAYRRNERRAPARRAGTMAMPLGQWPTYGGRLLSRRSCCPIVTDDLKMPSGPERSTDRSGLRLPRGDDLLGTFHAV